MPASRSSLHHRLIVGDAVAVEDRDDDGTGLRLGVELADQRQRGLQARDSDGEAGRRHRLAAEARDETVVAPAAADRAEAHGAALLVLRFDEKLNLVDRAGVIFEAADDGRVDHDTAVFIAGRSDQLRNVAKLLHALLSDDRCIRSAIKP